MFIIADDHQKNFSQSALLIGGRSRGDMRTTFSLRHVMVSSYEMPSIVLFAPATKAISLI
jgi:hypothetical protein